VNYLWFIIGKSLRRIAKFFNTTILFFSKTGLKSINATIDYGDLVRFQKKKLQSSQLFLFADGLIDSETLIGKNIKDSPHFDLISTIYNNKPLENCEYIIRAEEGRLDMRAASFYDPEFYLEKFRSQQKHFAKNKVTPLVVLPLDGKYYILDGKHRAAFFAFKEKPIDAYILPSIKEKPFLNNVLKKLHSKKLDNFSKNILILEKALK